MKCLAAELHVSEQETKFEILSQSDTPAYNRPRNIAYNKALCDRREEFPGMSRCELRDLAPLCTKMMASGIGVDLYDTYKVGSTIVWWGVSSCASDEKAARNFMAGCGSSATFLTVETTSACDISQLSF